VIRRLGNKFSPLKLRLGVCAFFIAVMTPAVALVYYSYTQLKWEAFYQQRAAATELSQRINAELETWLQLEEKRGVVDYQFLNVVGDSGTNFFQPSPLANYPVVAHIPGTLGYFQVNAQGEFTSPILPDSEAQALKYGVSTEQFSERKKIAELLKKVLSDNQLVQRDQQVTASEAVNLPETINAQETINIQNTGSSLTDNLRSQERRKFEDDSPNQIQSVSRLRPPALSQPYISRSSAESTQSFSREFEADDLRQSERNKPERNDKPGGIFDSFSSGSSSRDTVPYSQQYRRVDELKIGNTLEESAESQLKTKLQKKQNLKASNANKMRAPRKEQSILPASSPAINVDLGQGVDQENITMFESEVDPFEFRLLDSGHLVFYRKVWRDDTRFVQGMILERDVFLNHMVERGFRDSNLSAYTDLVVAYHGDVLAIFRNLNSYVLPGRLGEAYGELILESPLVPPFADVSLIFTVQRLQLGLGLKAIALAAFILMLVMGLGTWLMYRLGLRQMQVAQQQQDFVSAVSHELKTPLTSVRMYGELLKEGWASEEKKLQYYDYIVDESERLSRLINNVLQLAKMNGKDLNLSLVNTSIEALLDSLNSKLSAQVERSGFSLTLQCDDGVKEKFLTVDADAFMQVMINLIDNGIKFSEKSDSHKINVRVSEAANDQIKISVRDYGPGIAKPHLKKIFDLFYRGENELTRETVGTGIGLALVEQLMQAMSGRVDVVNCDPGAEFSLYFPLVEEIQTPNDE